MTKIFRWTTLIALTLNVQLTFGQKISEKEATTLLEKTVAILKSNDTSSFVGLWYLDNIGRPPYFKTPFTRKDIIAEFKELKSYLDTALVNNMKFDHVEIKDLSALSNYKVKYSITAWYLYDAKNKYYKGFGVRTDNIDNKWVYRFGVQYSVANR